MTFDQAESDIRCEWGEDGVAALASISDAVIIVDLMSFSTAVVIAVSRGACVYACRWNDESTLSFAQHVGAELVGARNKTKYSLSPASLMTIPKGTRLVLPSRNGSTLSMSTGATPTFAGCLRNAQAVAQAASRHGNRIAVIPCGERWTDSERLRPAVEDLVGAGAIISHLAGSRSPEAEIAVRAYRAAEHDLPGFLRQCSSGKELIAAGFEEDVSFTAELSVDDCAPILVDGAYVRMTRE